MKTEDFDRLKQICDENGFEFHVTDRGDEQVSIIIQKKDPWEGVEFVECKWSTLIYRAQDVQLGHDFKPSTESAYVEQLKQMAFERFGEIREGDRFEREYCELNPVSKIRSIFEPVFRYYKDSDSLTFQGTGIYQQDKWATKIERIEVEFTDDSWDDFGDYIEIGFVFKINRQNQLRQGIGEFLEEQLNKYLNEREH